MSLLPSLPTYEQPVMEGKVTSRVWFRFFAALAGIAIYPPSTVANLPKATPSLQGARGFVTDATSTVFLATAVGGGTNKVPVVCNGTTWVLG